MVIIVDSREQTPLSFPEGVEVERGGLYTGDYTAKGLERHLSIERKSIADLVGSLTSGRERFERELHRLRGYHFKRLLVIGSREEIVAGNYRSKASPRSILGSLDAFEVRYDVPVVFADEVEGARLVCKWCHYYLREIKQGGK